jgi:hypothetical protein
LRTLQSFLVVGVVCAAAAAILPGCGTSDPGTTGGTAGAPTGGAGAPSTAGAPAGGAPAVMPGNAANGATLYASAAIGCNACHGENAEGSLGPNITGSMTAGIGSWTEAQFYQVVRNGVARSGMKVCIEMLPFTAAMLSDQGVADIFAFVTSKTSDVAQRGSYVMLDPKCSTE